MCCTQYASKFGKLSSAYKMGKGQFSFQSQRRTMPKINKLNKTKESQLIPEPNCLALKSGSALTKQCNPSHVTGSL